MVFTHKERTENNSSDSMDMIAYTGNTTRTGEASSMENSTGDSSATPYKWSELDNVLVSCSAQAGYIPHIKEMDITERDSIVSRIQRSLKHATLEKRLNYFVMFTIILDIVLLPFESKDIDKASPTWVVFLSWLCILIYVAEVGFRLYIATPTMVFFRKRFYVFDLLIVVLCVLMQVASAMPALANIIRAIRLTRILRLLRLLRVLRVFTRLMEIWHDCNIKKMTSHQESVLSMNLKLSISSFKLHKVLSKQNYFRTVNEDIGEVSVMGNKKHLGVQDLFTIAELLKEEEDHDLFRFENFCLEWLMLLVLWLAFIIGLSWAFVTLESDNYDLVIQENLDLKALVDSSLPIREHMPDLLTTLANCEGDSSEETYTLLDNIYQEYNSTNKTLWNELESLEGPYTFMNPWTFEGSTFFTISIVTTIGYGTFTPLTNNGQLVVIFCSLPAIYLTIVFGQKNMELLQKGFCRTKYETVGLMGFFTLFFFLAYMLVGGWILKNSEDWTMWEAIYFCWVSFSTIGFGDYAPEVGQGWNVVFLSLVVVGWNVVIFVITVIEKLSKECKNIKWWKEHHLPQISSFRESNRYDSRQSHIVGVAQVVYNNKGDLTMNNEARVQELNKEIEKCKDRLRYLRDERKGLVEHEGSFSSYSSSDKTTDMIISLQDVDEQISSRSVEL